jgi:hypothetical protein
MEEIMRKRKESKCTDCGAIIDARSKRCYKCRALFNNSFKGKKHTEDVRKVIGEKSREKFTDDFIERVYRSKSRGGKKRDINGYVLIKDYESPSRNSHDDVLEHRKVMEETIGRQLRKEEIVHHINCVRNDNRIENLYLCSSRREHNREKKSLHSLVRELIEKKIIYFEKGEYKMYKETNKCVSGGNNG